MWWIGGGVVALARGAKQQSIIIQTTNHGCGIIVAAACRYIYYYTLDIYYIPAVRQVVFTAPIDQCMQYVCFTGRVSAYKGSGPTTYYLDLLA